MRSPDSLIREMLEITLVGGPTSVFSYGGLRWLTDPARSPPGEYSGGLVKTTRPALELAAIEPIDIVLLSHDHHSDNLDPAGREFLPRAGRILTTVEGSEWVDGNATGLDAWDSTEVQVPSGETFTVTAVPARSPSSRRQCCRADRQKAGPHTALTEDRRGRWAREADATGSSRPSTQRRSNRERPE